jgi:hypothetical protein
MGTKIFDQFTYLHFAAGIVAYFWGLTLKSWFILHIIFEIAENTPIGIKFINSYFKLWPGGKPKADSFINIVGDIIGAKIGWISAYYLDKLGNRYGWYHLHIDK